MQIMEENKKKRKDRLTFKMQRFAQEYIKDNNGLQSVLRAGYDTKNPHEMSVKLLNNPVVQAEIAKQREQLGYVAKINPAWVLMKLQTIVDRSMQAVPVMDKNGKHTGTWKYDSKGANAALQTIARHLGMLNDKLTVQGHVTVDQLSEEERAARITELLNRVRERIAEQGDVIDGQAIPAITQDSSTDGKRCNTRDDGSQ